MPCRAITLDNQLVVLATVAADAGRYHVEAVNEVTGESATSAAIYLSVSGNNRSKPSGFRLIYLGFLQPGRANGVNTNLLFAVKNQQQSGLLPNKSIIDWGF